MLDDDTILELQHLRALDDAARAYRDAFEAYGEAAKASIADPHDEAASKAAIAALASMQEKRTALFEAIE